MTKLRFSTIIFLIFFSFINVFSQQDIRTERIKKYVKYLASDNLEGRFPGTKGMDSAASFIAENFKRIGLKPITTGKQGLAAYYQDLKVTTGIKLGSGNVYKAEDKSVFELKKDWTPLGFSDNGSVSGNLVFVGYGIEDPKNEFDEYAGMDVKGKIVVAITGSPDKEKFKDYTSMRFKATTARNKGAKAIVFVNSKYVEADEIQDLQFENFGRNSGIIAINTSKKAFKTIFSGIDKYELKITENLKPYSKELDIPATVTVDLIDKEEATANIVGVLEGSDPTLKSEYVIVGGHYDHLGMTAGGNSLYRGKETKIHYGADDNASGAAAVIEIAEQLSKNPPKRSIVFITFTGEELGLLGSAYYTKNPLVPLEKTIFMVNLDMVGRLKENKLQIFGIGTTSGLDKPIDSLAVIDTLTIVKLQDGMGPSDHSSFFKKNIPVVHIFTGIHGDYHTPNDTWDKINFEGEIKVIDFSTKLANYFANKFEKPDFVKPKDVADTRPPVKNSTGAWFGIIPNFEESPDGCKISGASAGSPAKKAGLLENDIIKSINDKPIKNLYDFMYTVNEHKPGETLNVVIIRAGKEIKVDVTLAQKAAK